MSDESTDPGSDGTPRAIDASRVVDQVAEYDEDLADDVVRIIERGSALEDETEELELKLEQRDGEITELEADIELRDERIEQLETELELADERIDELEARLGDGGHDRVATLQERLEEREERIEDLQSKLKRKQADFQNFKKRAEKKRQRIQERATEDLVERILGVRDNLRRAIENDHPDVESLKEGLEMTLREFDRVLEDENVTEIDPDPGTDVDPQRHEVMMRVDSDRPEGSVAEVYTPGYEMADEVLRPAQVTVSTGPETDAEDAEEGAAAPAGDADEEGDGPN